MKVLLVVALLGLAGCGDVWPTGDKSFGAYPESLRIYIDPAIPSQPVMAGAAMWAEFISAKQVSTPEMANAWVSVNDESTCPDYRAGKNTDFGLTVAASRVSLHMSCWPNAAVEHDFDYVLVRWVAAHEFGHVMRMAHNDTAPAVMNTWIDLDRVSQVGPMITDADREEFRSMYRQ